MMKKNKKNVLFAMALSSCLFSLGLAFRPPIVPSPKLSSMLGTLTHSMDALSSQIIHDSEEPINEDHHAKQRPIPSTSSWVNHSVLDWHERALNWFGDKDTKIKEKNNLDETEVEIPDKHAVYDVYEILFGVPRELIRQHAAGLGKHTYRDMRFFSPSANWEMACDHNGEGLPRGSNLFIQGMGSFEVQAAYEKLIDRQRRQHKEDALSTIACFDIQVDQMDVPPADFLDSCQLILDFILK